MLDLKNLPSVPQHPDLCATVDEMAKWRSVFAGGDQFKDTYLKYISVRETKEEYLLRKSLTPVSGYAGEGIIEIRDMLFQHFPQVRRIGGSKSYQNAIQGLSAGVDLAGNSMDSFMGCEVALELILMGRVGILTDMPELKGPTLAENPNHRPYLYYYPREQIINWVPDRSGELNEFESILLMDVEFETDDLGFPKGDKYSYRRIYRDETDGYIYEQKWDCNCGFADQPKRKLGISRVPFVFVALSDSYMRRVADHQICLMNLESLDVNYLTKSNFPMLIEQSSKQDGDPSKKTTVVAGPTRGRKYPSDVTNAPTFIHPSSEPMKASIDKQEQIKIDIRRLLALSLSQIKQPTGNESKGTVAPQVSNVKGTASEAGLSAIGLALETAEQKIASFWAEYEAGRPDDENAAFISYPRIYTTKTDTVRLTEAENLAKMIDKTPSKTYQRVCAKELAETLFGGKIDCNTMDKIKKEIEEAEIVQTDSQTIGLDIVNGLADPETASIARGYPAGSVERAQKYAAERAAAIVVAQTKGAGHAANAQIMSDNLNNPASRGAKDLAQGTDGQTQAKNEKQMGKMKQKMMPKAPNPGGGQADRHH